MKKPRNFDFDQEALNKLIDQLGSVDKFCKLYSFNDSVPVAVDALNYFLGCISSTLQNILVRYDWAFVEYFFSNKQVGQRFTAKDIAEINALNKLAKNHHKDIQALIAEFNAFHSKVDIFLDSTDSYRKRTT